MNIRLFNKNDFKMIQSWWKAADEMAPTIEMLPEDSTFILEIDEKPQICITLYLTNAKYISYLENFVKNPELKNSKEYSKKLVKYVENFAKENGCKILVCLSYKEKLKKRYEELGYMNTLNNISSFAKEL